MSQSLRVASALLALALTPLTAQITLLERNGGSGIDGVFAPTSNTTLDSDVQAVYEFATMDIPAGVVVTCAGSRPMTIKVAGNARIDGTLDASGMTGGSSGNNQAGGLGGAGGPGGWVGGDGACNLNGPFNGTGTAGAGPGGGGPGMDTMVSGSFTDPVGGGGGGGNATAGMNGGTANSGVTAPMSPSGNGGMAVSPCQAGSGGGGGGCDVDSPTAASSNDGGGGGGGGGGMLCLFSDGLVTVSAGGAVLADGGAGGTSSGNGGGGGGGSGGYLEIVAPAIVIDGTVSAVGGVGGAATQSNCGCSPGGAGGDGCVVFRGDLTGSTNITAVTPTPSATGVGTMVSVGQPTSRIDVAGIGGNDFWVAGISVTLAPAPGLALGGGEFVLLDFNDPLFALSYPNNMLSPLISGLSGNGPSTIDLDFLNAGFVGELTVFAQAVKLGPGALDASNVLPIYIKFL